MKPAHSSILSITLLLLLFDVLVYFILMLERERLKMELQTVHVSSNSHLLFLLAF